MDEQESAVAGTVDDTRCIECARTKAKPCAHPKHVFFVAVPLGMITGLATLAHSAQSNGFTHVFMTLSWTCFMGWLAFCFWRNGVGSRFDITIDVDGNVHAHRREQTVGLSWITSPCWYWNGRSDSDGDVVQRETNTPMLRVSLGWLPRCKIFDNCTNFWPYLKQRNGTLRIEDQTGGGVQLPIIDCYSIDQDRTVASQLYPDAIRQLMSATHFHSASALIAGSTAAMSAEESSKEAEAGAS